MKIKCTFHIAIAFILIQLTDDIYTYENQVKYLDVTSQIEVDMIEVEDYLFLTL